MATAVNNDIVVEAVGLTKVFSDFWLRQKAVAVDGISFEIRRDEIFGLLGPNGSGKSTTIKMILGLLHRSKGNLTVFGKDPTDVAVKRRIGYLPEESYMYRFLTPVETLDFYGKLFGLPRAIRRSRIDELLEMVGMTHAANRPVGEFSKGMARRLGIAQALINDPDLLILDEPTSGLDPLGSRQVKDLLLDLGRRGKTILLSSHQLDDVQDVCDRMVILYGGKIRSEGTVDELLEDSGRTVITTSRLDAATITTIERIIRETAHVEVERVAAPRQRLEDLFLQIVERARNDRASTSGAGAGGPTAAFLRGEENEGGGLIAELEAMSQAAKPSAAAVTAAPVVPVADAAVLTELVTGEPSAPVGKTEPAVSPSKPTKAPEPPKDVDRSVIDDLLGGGGNP
ncbi:MAG: putative transporter ATP-binding protein YxlF [Planctomycetota bacterium]